MNYEAGVLAELLAPFSNSSVTMPFCCIAGSDE